jgi:hypothetical protein
MDEEGGEKDPHHGCSTLALDFSRIGKIWSLFWGLFAFWLVLVVGEPLVPRDHRGTRRIFGRMFPPKQCALPTMTVFVAGAGR